MPHLRKRHILSLFLRKFSYSRVVSIQGARQTGKSVFSREILVPALKDSSYVTFDQLGLKKMAESSPENFFAKYREKGALLIDEAQKSPEVFDHIKLMVDQNQKPGQFVLLGSTEFSHELKIKESLTGRMSRIRVYPFTLSETLNLSLNSSKEFSLVNLKARASREDLFRYLKKGGFPGIFSLREEAQRHELLESWISLVCERDIAQLKTMKLDPDLCLALVREIPLHEHADLATLAKALSENPRRLKTHLKGLQILFVIDVEKPHRLSAGKEAYRLIDVGLSSYLGQAEKNTLRQWVKFEQQAQRAAMFNDTTQMTYFKGAKGGKIDLVLENKKLKKCAAIKVLFTEKVDKRELKILHAFKEKIGGEAELYALSPIKESFIVEGVRIIPYESII